MAVLVALVALVVALVGGGDDDRETAAGDPAPTSATATEPSLGAGAPGADATPPEVAPESGADEPPASLAPVALDQEADAGDGVTARVIGLEAIEGTGTGRGNVSGPALRLTVGITNGSGDAIDLGSVAVNLAYGVDAVPASPLNDPSQAPLSGSLDTGETGEGVYVFSVPQDARGTVSVSVGYRAGAPFMVFTGAAA
ncbi:hypothetical protein [Blastococcus sp. TF02A-26]|uniref:hypothetical protein n=1 Tax=Blastococcus sp. TF02A-26 TaxID=2250577 RepID=UPI000DEB3E16|nr:hypothetical protein [Blastococcus sp. TF02A-26]RBY86145.1 hypothetical protein DQ240_10085 [Blastococcus sp. TF02A-26]